MKKSNPTNLLLRFCDCIVLKAGIEQILITDAVTATLLSCVSRILGLSNALNYLLSLVFVTDIHVCLHFRTKKRHNLGMLVFQFITFLGSFCTLGTKIFK